MGECKKAVLSLDAQGLSDEDIQSLEQMANAQFNVSVKIIRAVSIEDLAREVSGKCLQHASDLLDDKVKWMGDDAKLVRYLVEIAAEAKKMIPNAADTVIGICGSIPQHREADKKAMADAIREILTEEAGNLPPLDYT